MKEKEIKKIVREGYAKIAKKGPCCCQTNLATDVGKKIGYKDEDLNSVPAGSDLGLGCGNPIALASLKEGETVLDLGCGAGFDCFLAANKVGRAGSVIGVDMTPEMIDKARENAKKGNYENVEFRLGEIENIPAADNSVDAVISNCVINLSPHKGRVFEEAFRVLKPGGRLMVSDMVLLKELPDFIKKSEVAYIGCIAGAVMKETYLKIVKEAGFQDVRVMGETNYPVECVTSSSNLEVEINKTGTLKDRAEYITDSVASLKVHGIKPK